MIRNLQIVKLNKGELMYEIFGMQFNSLKARIYESKKEYDQALKCYLTVPIITKMADWKYRTWGPDDQYRCPGEFTKHKCNFNLDHIHRSGHVASGL